MDHEVIRMTTGQKIAKLRKDNNLTQEELAAKLGVSRQSISKWESDAAFPETDKLVKLSEMFDCTVDYLLKYNQGETKEETNIYFPIHKRKYEYKSKKMLFGIPLVHINIGFNTTAKGMIAIGFKAKGLISFGVLSLGLLSFGVLSLGLISLGVFALGLMSFAAIALAIVSVGAIAVGIFSIGAIAIGYFSVGALAIAKYVAIGDHARGMFAIGKTYANGIYTYVGNYNISELKDLMNYHIPKFFHIFVKWIMYFL